MKSRSLTEWENSLSTLKENTRLNYVRYLDRFMNEHNLQHDEVFRLKLDSMKADDPRDNIVIEKMVNTSIHTAINVHGNAPSTAKLIAISVNEFLKANGMRLNWNVVKVPKYTAQGVRVITREQIIELLNYSICNYPFRNRALFLFLKDSGLAISDALAYNYGEYKKGIIHLNDINEKFIEFASVHRIKTGVLGYPHIGPEAITGLDNYVEKRISDGETLVDSSPLFVNSFGNRLTRDSIGAYMRRAVRNIPSIKRRVSLHSFRKFHETYLEPVMSKNCIMKLQLKMIHNSDSPYSNPQDLPYEDPENLTTTYIRCYDSIRLFINTADFVKLKSRMDFRDSEIDELKKKNVELYKMLDALIDLQEKALK